MLDVCPSSHVVFEPQSVGCYFLPFAAGTLLSMAWGLVLLLTMVKRALDPRCPSSSDLFRPGFGRQDVCIPKAGNWVNDAIPCVGILPVPGHVWKRGSETFFK